MDSRRWRGDLWNVVAWVAAGVGGVGKPRANGCVVGNGVFHVALAYVVVGSARQYVGDCTLGSRMGVCTT